MADKIETLDDWNARMGCCCTMPGAPAPELVCESLNVAAGEDYLFYDEEGRPHSKIIRNGRGSFSESSTYDQYNPGGTYNFWLTGAEYTASTVSVTEGRKQTEEVIPPLRVSKCGANTYPTISKTREGSYNRKQESTMGYVNAVDGGLVYQTHLDSDQVITITAVDNEWVRSEANRFSPATSDNPWAFGPMEAGNNFSVPWRFDPNEEEVDYEKPVAMDAAKTIVMSLIKSVTFLECPEFSGSSCQSLYGEQAREIPGVGRFIQSAWATKTRYRWKIPADWKGNKFKITWNVLTRPAIGAPILEGDMTWSWQGPGNPKEPDGDSWKSPFYDLAAPDVQGTRGIVNIRFEAIPNNPYGTKPQIAGEAYDG